MNMTGPVATTREAWTAHRMIGLRDVVTCKGNANQRIIEAIGADEVVLLAHVLHVLDMQCSDLDLIL
jgi:hypothetical protein